MPEISGRPGHGRQFLENQLKPELLEAACAQAGIPLTLRRQEGYDHSYYFIATFIEDHLRWHAERLSVMLQVPNSSGRRTEGLDQG